MGKGFPSPDTGIVDKKFRLEIVRGINDKIVVFYESTDIICSDPEWIGSQQDMRVERLQGYCGRRHLQLTDPLGRVQNLPLQIGKLNNITVHNTDPPDPCGNQIKKCRRA